MIAHQPHCLPRRRPHGRRAQPLGEPPDGALRRLAGLDHPGRHAERPRRGVDEEGAGSRLVVDEVTLAELVLDELVGGAGVRHPQQRFRQHHQRQPFLGRQRELAQHVLDAAQRIVIGPDRLDQAGRRPIDARLPRRIQPHSPEQAGRHGAIVGRVGRAEGRRRNQHAILLAMASLAGAAWAEQAEPTGARRTQRAEFWSCDPQIAGLLVGSVREPR
jgi:hypothetical protein